MSDRPPGALPRFSVVIPTCRRNDSLARCLNRLMPGAQTLPSGEYEVIVSDDGPDTDNARLLVENTYPWARWVAGPKHGPGRNRNRGAAEARGEWLAFVDDDCLPSAGWLAAFAARIDGRGNGSGPRVFEGRTSSDTGGKPMGLRFTAPVNEKGGLLWSCNFAIERRLFEELGGFDEEFPYPYFDLEDVDFRLRLDDHGEMYPFVSDAAVDHPPRQIAPLLNVVRSQEAAWYLARKRGVRVGQIGPRPATYLRIYVHGLRRCRGLKDVLWVTWRHVGQPLLMLFYLPYWQRKYPQKKL